jgi:hypothetical protein
VFSAPYRTETLARRHAHSSGLGKTAALPGGVAGSAHEAMRKDVNVASRWRGSLTNPH